MANPLSDEGVSDRDFAAAVGIAMGETGSRRISKEEMAAVIDVAMNRLEGYDRNPHKATERSLHGVITARGQFDASNPRGSKGGREKYNAGYNAIMNGAPVPANMRARYETAVKQAVGVLSKDGPWRGVARNAEYFSSTAKKLSSAKAREHNKLGKQSGTKIGASTFYGPEHTKQYGKRDAPTPARREADYSQFGPLGTPRERLSQPFATEDYSKFGPLGTPREAIAPTAPLSLSALDFGPDFSSPPSQARGPVTDPTGFSNINTAAEAAPGSFANFGPNAFGALDQPVDYGRTYPELSAGLYPDIAPPDVPAVPDVMSQFDVPGRWTEQEALARSGLAGQRPSENVEVRPAEYGETVDEQVARNASTRAINDTAAAVSDNLLAGFGVRVDPATLTTDPYAARQSPTPAVDYGIWGGTTPFNDRFTGANLATPTFQGYEERAPLAGLGIGGITSLGPIGMGTRAGVDVPRDYSGISAGLYEGPFNPDVVADAIRNAPVTPSPMTIETFNSIFGNLPDDATGSVRNAQMSAAPPVNAPLPGGPYSFSDLQSWAPAPAAATIPGDVTGFGAGSPFGSRAPSPAFDFADIVNSTQWSGAAPANAPSPAAQPAQAPLAETSEAFNARMSDLLAPGPPEMSPFQGTPLGVGRGIIDQGPYSSPIGYSTDRFSPASLAPAAAPQRDIVGYETKTITKDVPNPAWSDWSRDYATKNAVQDAWLAADEDKAAWDRAPPNPSVLANTSWAFPDEPAKTTPRTEVVRDMSKPIYGPAVPTASVPAASVPAVTAQPARAALAPAVAAPAVTAPVTGGWWDSFMSGLGSMFGGVGGGLNLAGLGGDYSGYGAFGGGWGSTDGGLGGTGGTAPGDAGFGSDARSGSSNMGAGNLYS